MIFDKIKKIFRKEKEENIAEKIINENKEKDAAKEEESVLNEAETFEEAGEADNTENIDDAENIDFDKEINDLMQMDSEMELKDVDYEYINDITVYDTVRNDKENVLKSDDESNGETDENDEQEKEGIGTVSLVLYGVIAFLILLIIIAGIFLMLQLGKYKNTKTVSKDTPAASLSVPEYKVNNANYIYVSQKAMFDEQEIMLDKILVDSTATMFYFDSKIDVQKYNIILTDDKDIMYGMDLSFIQNMYADNNDKKETVLRFEPLDINTRSIKLTFYNIQTGERVSFDFDFEGQITKTPVRYIFDRIVSDENSKIKVNIDSAVFSSAGSKIEYTLEAPESNFKIVHGGSKFDTSVVLEEGSTSIRKTKNYPSLYSFENGNMMLGRMDFESIVNLNSKIYISFENLFKSYDMRRDIPVSALDTQENAEPFSFDVENYKVVLEGFGSFNKESVLVFHAEDKNIQPENPDGTDNRVEVRLDAQLVATADSGMETVLEGQCRSAQYGTDMVFPISESSKNFLFGIGRRNLSIRINSVLIKTDDIETEFDLSKIPQDDNDERLDAASDIVDIFKGRLAYKSGEKSIESITGFDEELLKNGGILDEYSPEQITEKAQYSAQVISSALRNGRYYAVVQEVWKAVDGIKEKHIYRTHKIVAEKRDHFWNIVQDNVIK